MDSEGNITQYDTREIHRRIVMYERKTPTGKKRTCQYQNNKFRIYKKLHRIWSEFRWPINKSRAWRSARD
jgi:hypothetical protein